MRSNFIAYGAGGYNTAKAANNVVSTGSLSLPGLGADKLTFTANGLDVVTLHYASDELSAAWSVDGSTQTVAMTPVLPSENGSGGTLNESVIEVTATQAGPLLVTCNGASLLLTAL